MAAAVLLATPASGLAQQRDENATSVGGWQDVFFGYAAYKAAKYDEAIALWLPLAEAGDARAMEFVGVLHEFGQGVPRDPGKALAWYRRAAEAGSSVARYNLGRALLNGSLGVVDAAEAERWLGLAADQGDADALELLARARTEAGARGDS